MLTRIFILSFLTTLCRAGSSENRLLEVLMKDYSVLERPTIYENDTVPLKINLKFVSLSVKRISKISFF